MEDADDASNFLTPNLNESPLTLHCVQSWHRKGKSPFDTRRAGIAFPDHGEDKRGSSHKIQYFG